MICDINMFEPDRNTANTMATLDLSEIPKSTAGNACAMSLLTGSALFPRRSLRRVANRMAPLVKILIFHFPNSSRMVFPQHVGPPCHQPRPWIPNPNVDVVRLTSAGD